MLGFWFGIGFVLPVNPSMARGRGEGVTENDPKFNTPQYFPTVREASLASGIPVSSIRSTRSTMSHLNCKTTCYTYTITWLTPRVKILACIVLLP